MACGLQCILRIGEEADHFMASCHDDDSSCVCVFGAPAAFFAWNLSVFFFSGINKHSTCHPSLKWSNQWDASFNGFFFKLVHLHLFDFAVGKLFATHLWLANCCYLNRDSPQFTPTLALELFHFCGRENFLKMATAKRYIADVRNGIMLVLFNYGCESFRTHSTRLWILYFS